MTAKPGDTCWAIVPLTDTNRGCGCSSGGWTGEGVYYGGFVSGCTTCTCQGGGFSGVALNGVAKGGVNVGIQITVHGCVCL